MDEEAIGDLVEAICDTSKMQPAKRVKTEAQCDGMPLTSDMYNTEGELQI